MYTHVMVGTNNIAKAKQFYDACFIALGGKSGLECNDRIFYQHNGGSFAIGLPANGEVATFANGGTIGFAAGKQADVDAWYAAGLEGAGRCEGKPGHRAEAPGNAYGAYLRDPDGNKICSFVPNGD
jgi:catechol 2,3-dioxygenase-like lactoylglutathione lyase family enzyme